MNLTPTQLAYREYLQSDHWKDLKRRKTEATPRRCSICASKKKIQLHHLFYRSRWEDAKLEDLRWVCEFCHLVIHQLIDTKKLGFPKPDNHHSCFAITKAAVLKWRMPDRKLPKAPKGFNGMAAVQSIKSDLDRIGIPMKVAVAYIVHNDGRDLQPSIRRFLKEMKQKLWRKFSS